MIVWQVGALPYRPQINSTTTDPMYGHADRRGTVVVAMPDGDRTATLLGWRIDRPRRNGTRTPSSRALVDFGGGDRRTVPTYLVSIR